MPDPAVSNYRGHNIYRKQCPIAAWDHRGHCAGWVYYTLVGDHQIPSPYLHTIGNVEQFINRRFPKEDN